MAAEEAKHAETASMTRKFEYATTLDEKMELITRNLQEVMGGDNAIKRIRDIVKERDLKIYWGTATTGKPHVAYFVPMSKIADFLRAGCQVTILFADLHAYLDNMKAPWDLLAKRAEYYKHVIKNMLRSIGVPLEKLTFIQGTEFQLGRPYTLDVYRLSSMTTLHYAQKAGADVVKESSTPPISGLLYPLLQALDEQYLDVDCQFGGVDQRKIFTFAEENLPRIGYAKRLHLMNPMVPGLTGGKMSSSEANSKIDILDTKKQVKKKVNGAFCEEGNVDNNPCLEFVEKVLLPISTDGIFRIARDEKYGGPLQFDNYASLRKAFEEKTLYPPDLKLGVCDALDEYLIPIREVFDSDAMKQLTAEAYPPPEKKQKKKDDAGAGGAVTIQVAEFRIGRIVECQECDGHDKLYQLSIDIGDGKEGNHQVISGLRAYFDADALRNRLVVCWTNLSPSIIHGMSSEFMIMAASSGGGGGGGDDAATPQLLTPPASCALGERCAFEGFPHKESDDGNAPEITKKQFQKIKKKLTTNDACEATWNGVPFTTSAGSIVVSSLANTPIM